VVPNGRLLRQIHYHSIGRILRLHFSGSVWGTLRPGKVKFLLRVDDFPRWDLSFEDYLPFSELMNDTKIPFLLGVTPFLNFNNHRRELTAEEIDYLYSASNNNFALSLHGFTHEKASNPSYYGRLNEYKEDELEQMVSKAQDWFRSQHVPFPQSFIPPFNSMNASNAMVLPRHFPVLFGGPLSLTTMGPLGIGEMIDNALYLPSYFPFYGHCDYLSKNLSKLIGERDVVIPVTVHWAWEITDGFKNLKLFLNEFRDRFVSFNYTLNWWRSLLNDRME
jgi:Uncharacterized protein conserved in bacteria (DUF2334)